MYSHGGRSNSQVWALRKHPQKLKHTRTGTWLMWQSPYLARAKTWFWIESLKKENRGQKVWLKEDGACIVSMKSWVQAPGPQKENKTKKSETCLHVFTKMYLQADSSNTVYNSPKLNKDQGWWNGSSGREPAFQHGVLSSNPSAAQKKRKKRGPSYSKGLIKHTS
jgi:hypothetical protein